MYKVTDSQLKLLARGLPHLIEFGMGISENLDQTTQMVLRFLPKLKKLTIGLDAWDYRRIFDDAIESIQNIHARFVVKNTEIQLVDGGDSWDGFVSISKERTFLFDGNSLKVS